MRKVTTTNFEEWYLDYLEGNLSEQDVLHFENFLAENPHLQVESDLPSFFAETPSLDLDKSLLRQFDSTEEISKDNVDLFLIADLEKQLSFSEQNRLESFLIKHPEFRNNQKLVGLTKAIPSASLVYGDTSDLKHKKTIPLWPIMAVAAATIAGFVFFDFNSLPSNSLTSAAHHGFNTHRSTLLPQNNSAQNHLVSANLSAFGQKRGPSSAIPFVPNSKTATVTPRLNAKKITYLDRPTIGLEPMLPQTHVVVPTYKTTESTFVDNALGMKNPIAPVTRALSDVIKQEVDYQKGMNASKERKGFYLKIGNFEISTNRKIRSSQGD